MVKGRKKTCSDRALIKREVPIRSKKLKTARPKGARKTFQKWPPRKNATTSFEFLGVYLGDSTG